MSDGFIRVDKRVKFCPACRVAILTLTTEEQQDDGSWKEIRIVRNCGHIQESDPK